MYRTIRYSIAGIEVRATLAWVLVVVALIGVSVHAGVPADFGRGSVLTRPGLLVLLALGILISLAAHEASHVLLAGRVGHGLMAVSPQLAGTLPDTLYEAESPANEVRVGLVGPGVSLLLGLLSGVIWLLVRNAASEPLSIAIGLIALANLGFAAVSLMPGYPFDGGRAVRGFLWFLTGDLFNATKIVGYIGYVIIMGGMAAGVLLIVSGGTLAIWGFWVLMTSFMINRGVGDGITHIFWTINSERLRVNDLFVGGTRRVRSDVSIDEAIERLLEGFRDGPMLVVEDDEAVGLVDLSTIRPVPRKHWPTRAMADVMTPIEGLPQVSHDAPLRELVQLLPPEVDAIALITRDERVIGATDRQDVVRRFQEYLAAERLDQLRRGR